MKITSINTYVMGIPGPSGRGPRRNWIFVEVHTDEGLTGVGEATTEYHEQAVVAMIGEHFAPMLVGQDPTRVTHLWRVWSLVFFHGQTDPLPGPAHRLPLGRSDGTLQTPR